MKHNWLTKLLLPIISGLLTGISFYSPQLYFLNWFSLVPLLLVIKTQTPGEAFRSGLLSGISFFVIIFYWLIYPQLIFDLPLLLAVGLVMLLCILLSFFWGIFTYLANYVIKNYRSVILFLIPAIWTGLEYLRTIITSNLTFGTLGYSQAYFPILIQIADLTGVYGVTFFIILINVFMYELILSFTSKSSLNKLKIIMVSFVILFVIIYGLFNLKQPLNERIMTLKLGLVQPNIPQKIKWTEQYRTDIINRYINLTEELITTQNLDLIIWPETAVPFILNEANSTWQKYFFQKIQMFKTPLFTGILNKINNNIYNQAILINSNSQIIRSYNKLKLVPFGEYMPFRSQLPNWINDLIVDKTPGNQINNFNLKNTIWATPICSEILNSKLVNKLARRNQFLINLSNEAWFKKSNAPLEIWQATILRAVENNIPIIKVSNTGITGVIGPHGKIKAKIQPFQSGNLIWNLKIKDKTGVTIYNKYGNYFVYMVIFFSSIFFLLHFLKSKLITIK